MGECRAGLRRYVGTPRGENYQELIAYGGDGDYTDPAPHERTLADHIDPTRPGRMMGMVNVVSRSTKMDAAGWQVDRLLSMVAMIQQDPGPQVPE